MFIQINSIEVSKIQISSIQADYDNLILYIILNNGTRFSESFTSQAELNARKVEIEKDMLWVDIIDRNCNIMDIASLNKDSIIKEETTIYQVIYILNNGTNLIEEFDSEIARDEKFTYVYNLKFTGSGGGGGTDNYELLQNKPKINDVTLFGNLDLDTLNIQGKLIAGAGITINEETNEITSSGGAYTNEDPSVIAVGGIKTGTTFENVTYSEMFDMMLYPELFPTLSSPKLTTTLNVTTLEVGSITNAKLTASFNRGTINPAYKTSGYRSGLPISYVFEGETYSSSGLTFTKDLEITSDTEQSFTYSVRCNYSAGEQPLSSKGNNYSTPLAAGYVNASDSVNIVFPYFANTSTIDTLTKQALTKVGTYIQVSLAGEDEVNKQSISYANILGDITRISVLNTLNNKWEDAVLSSFTKTTEERNINGVTQIYNTYKFNGSKIGARTIRFYV